jgi:SOS response regulatory protein OraA/RecX
MLKQRLLREGYDTQEVSELVSSFAEKGLVSDAHFAEIFTRSKANAGYGRNYIANELEKYDIYINTYPDIYEEYLNDESELERAMAVLATYHGKAKDLSGALNNRLMNKGFTQAISITAVKQYFSEKE